MINSKLTSYGLLMGRILSVLLILSCHSNLTMAGPENINNTTESATMILENPLGWQLKRMINGENLLQEPLEGKPVTLFFQGDQIRGSGGCNNYFAAYTHSGNELSISEAGATMMACPELIMAQESRYMGLLSKVSGYSLEHDELKLSNNSNQSILVFSAIQPESIIGGIWRLGSYLKGDGLISNKSMQNITAEFNKEGKVTGFAGCNRYSGSYTIQGEQMQFSPLMTTRKFCPQPEDIMVTEANFLSAMNRVVQYRIENKKLTMLSENGKTLVVFGKE